METRTQLELLRDCDLVHYIIDEPSDSGAILAAAAENGVFVAALADGRIVLADAPGLPDHIRSSAIALDPVQRQNHTAALEPTFQTSREASGDLAAVLDKISTQMDQLLRFKSSERQDGPLDNRSTDNTQDEAMNPNAQSLSTIITKLDQLQSDLHHTDPSNVLAEILAQLAQRSASLTPTVDMAPIHQSIARQGTAMAHVIARLESVCAAFEARHTIEANIGDLSTDSLAVITTALAANTDLINAQTTQNDELLQRIKHMADVLQKLQITDVCKPVLPNDITAQRQTFARFGTALNTAISRLEVVTSELEHPRESDGLASTLSGIADRYFTMCEGNRDHLADDLIAQLKSRLGDTVIAPTTIQSADPSEKLTELVDDLRFATAELLAAHTLKTARAS